MPTTRREVLGVGASLALGALPAVAAPMTDAPPVAAPGSGGQTDWDTGVVDHLLPTSSHDRILVKASFRRPLDGAPAILVGDRRVPGQRTDTHDAFWQFQADDLKPGIQHRLALVDGDGRALCQPWTLVTMPAHDDGPDKLRLLVYSCAGGHDLFARAGTGFEFLPVAVRQRLSFAPDALIANGDHVYWDLLVPRADRGYRIVGVAPTINFPLGIYSKRHKSFDAIPNGGTIAIQNDPTNGGRSLLLLQDKGVIKLRPGTGFKPSPADIVENPRKLRFIEVEAAQTPRALDDVDAAAINGNYATPAGLKPSDAILKEEPKGPYVNLIAVREADKDQPWVKALVESYRTPETKAFIEKTFGGTILPSW